MIYLYSGTPGSGKSLHTAQVIKGKLRTGHMVICNFELNRKQISKWEKNFRYIPNGLLEVQQLEELATEYFSKQKFAEGKIVLIIDEAQLIFNSRDWSQKGRDSWLSFFSQHRHYGFDVILVAQYDRMLDRQIRCLIEYEVVHRKVSNCGIKGKIASLIAGGKLFVTVSMWYPLKNEKVGHEFFKYSKRDASLYDSYAKFSRKQGQKDADQISGEKADEIIQSVNCKLSDDAIVEGA